MNESKNDITIILATNNRDKVKEIKPLLETIASALRVYSLADLDADMEIEETEDSLEGNAKLKADAVFNRFSKEFPSLVTLADDTGLEVAGLGGAPGVYSARFAPVAEGKSPTYDDNVRFLLHKMEHVTDRKATFRTVIALKGHIRREDDPSLFDTFETTVEGFVKGEITREKRGDKGFGYDPVFWVNSAQATFAQMSTDEKNTLSHRSMAVKKAVEQLRKIIRSGE